MAFKFMATAQARPVLLTGLWITIVKLVLTVPWPWKQTWPVLMCGCATDWPAFQTNSTSRYTLKNPALTRLTQPC